MYYHTAICDQCGREFTVEVRAGEPVNRTGVCGECRRQRDQKVKMIVFGVGTVAVLILIAIATNCG